MHVPFSYTSKCEQAISLSTPEYSLSRQQCPLTTLEGLFCICSMELFWVWLETYVMYGGHQSSSSTARDTWEKMPNSGNGRNFLLGEHSPTPKAHLLVSTQDKGYFPLCQKSMSQSRASLEEDHAALLWSTLKTACGQCHKFQFIRPHHVCRSLPGMEKARRQPVVFSWLLKIRWGDEKVLLQQVG